MALRDAASAAEDFSEAMVVGEEATNGVAGPEEEVAGAIGPAVPPPPAPTAPATPAPAAPQSNGKPSALTSNIHNIMGGMERTEGVKLHNHRRKLRQRFDIVRKLGQGTYGKVQLGINKETGQEVAIKTIKKAKIETEADLIRIRREIQIMSSVRHPNIIHIYEVFENREKMVLVMEYAAGGELYDYLSERKVLAELEARRIFRQIATAVYYCHKHKICHRDLKLENILLDDTGNAKIADFGLSNVFDEQRLLSTFCGSPLYASPEIVKGTPYHGPEVDCWSLGVLLYTLVYGAMPFDGSNFKKLVKQISQGDYFEPKKPSPASPLIREMLTVTPRKRADIERICAHWWVNEGASQSCLEEAEALANQTPVRLDLLLSLAPAPSADKLVLPETRTEESTPVTALPPSSFPRSQSVGSLMELDYPRKQSPPQLPQPPPPSIPPPVSEESSTAAATAPKRKLQECPSGETDPKRKETTEKSQPEVLVAEAKKEEVKRKEESMEVDEQEKAPKIKEKRKSIKGKKEAKPAVVEKSEEASVSAGPKEVQQEAVMDKTAKVKRKKKVEGKSDVNGETSEPTIPAENAVIPESVVEINDATPVSASMPPELPPPVTEISTPPAQVPAVEETPIAKEPSPRPTPAEPKKEESSKESSPVKRRPQSFKGRTKTEEIVKAESASPEKSPSSIPKVEARRKSSIFEKAEKFNSLSTSNVGGSSNQASPEKGKKLFIPGVKISDFKKAFEKKPPAKSASATKASEETKPDPLKLKPTTKSESPKITKKVVEPKQPSPLASPAADKPPQRSPEESKKPKPAELSKPDLPKPKPKTPTLDAKPPTPEIKSKTPIESKSDIVIAKPKPIIPNKAPSPPKSTPATLKSAPSPVTTPEREPLKTAEPAKKKSTTMKITLESTPKSATLPRRTSKAEIRLNAPGAPPAPKPEYRTEVEHMVGVPAPQVIKTQRSEVAFPVAAPQNQAPAAPNMQRVPRPYKHSNTAPTGTAFRSMSLEPDTPRSRERIIPIQVEGGPERPIHRDSPPVRGSPAPSSQPSTPGTGSQPGTPRPVPGIPGRGRESLSRQSTLESDTETVRGEPIRKSPREFIIPIAMEGGGYITPRAGSLEPTSADSGPSTPTRARPMRLQTTRPLPRRMGLLSEMGDGAEFESPGGGSSNSNNTNNGEPHTPLHRMSSDPQAEEPPGFLGAGGGTLGRGLHMHRLRSSRPSRPSLEHNDSFSSGEEDDEDDGFEILTAESLFSTLLSRVRNLTQRLNVEDRPGAFPSSRLLNHMPAFSTQTPSLFSSNFHSRLGEPLSRRLSEHSRMARGSSRGVGAQEDGGMPPWRRSLSRDHSDTGDSVYSEHHTRGEATDGSDYCPTPSRSSRMHQQQPPPPPSYYPHQYGGPEPYRRTLSSLGTPGDLHEVYRRSYSTDHHPRPYLPPEQDPRYLQENPSFYGTLRTPRRFQEELSRPKPNRSVSLNRDNSWKKNPRVTPDRSQLGRFVGQDIHEMSPPTPPPLTNEERKRGRRVSRFLRPDFYDTPREESVYARQREEEQRNRREREQRKSVERKTLDEECKGRVTRAISSLQQRRNSQDLTESSLIKRAVSSDDCAQYTEPPQRSGSKVSSVLGMFKKMEKPAPEKSPLSRFRRAQSVYEASSSDSLASNKEDNPRKAQLRGEGNGLRVEIPHRPSAFMPYSPRTPSEEKSVDGDIEDDYSQPNSRQDDSFDSWSVCSDNTDPLEDETVSDRIRRKSFYTRFNDYVAPKKQPAKASPAVAAILERDFRRPQRHNSEKHRRKHGGGSGEMENGSMNGDAASYRVSQGSQQQQSQPQQTRRRYNLYGSLPRGWEPQAEAEYYNQARTAAPVLNRYGQQHHPSAPLFPPSAVPIRRP